MLRIESYGKFKPLGKQKKKKQIILCHTSREVDEYLTSLAVRYNGKYNRIPNYLIKKDGTIIQLLPEYGHTQYFTEESLNRNSVVISFENLGWLEKKPLTNEYINWKGSIYKGEVFEKKWRDFFFWDPYTKKQYQSAADLCKELAETLQIEKRCIGHNTKVEGIENYGGIITRSNLNQTFTDLNPSFKFENFIKYIENEQFVQ
jgi:N-acetyl-anhydromuramyl-L-alanine amidase AmpD